MIVKPTEADFRAGAAEIALRETGKIAAEGSKGVFAGFISLRNMYFKFIGGFFLLILVGGVGMAINPVLGGFGILGMLGWFGARLFSGESATLDVRNYAAPAAVAALVAPENCGAIENGECDLDVAKLVQRGVVCGVPGLLAAAGSRSPTMLAIGIGLMVLAIMVSGRAFFGRRAVHWDRGGITAYGLIGNKTLAWHDITQISLERAGFNDMSALFTSGSRRNLVLVGHGAIVRGIPRNRVLIPLDLLALSKEGVDTLITRLMTCQARYGAQAAVFGMSANAGQHFAAPPSPAIPRAIAPIAYAPEPRPSGDAFDPDQIMARYLAEREKVIADARPDLQSAMASPPARRAGFGRRGL